MIGGASEGTWISLVALTGWLVLVLSAYRSYRVDTAKTVRLALTWAAIFIGVAILFGLIL